MAQYQSSHSGQEYDEAVTRVLQGTCGIQGVKVNGTAQQPDSNIDVSYSVTTPGNDYMGLSSLPYSAYSEGGINWPLSVCCMYSSTADFTNNIGARIVGERIEFMNNNGKSFINCSDFSNSSCVFNIAGFYRMGV